MLLHQDVKNALHLLIETSVIMNQNDKKNPENASIKILKHKTIIFPNVISGGNYREFYDKKEGVKMSYQVAKKQIKQLIQIVSFDMEITYEGEDLDMSETDSIILGIDKHLIVRYEKTIREIILGV